MKICNLIYIILGVFFLKSSLISSEGLSRFKESNTYSCSTYLSQLDKMNFYSQASQDKFVYGLLYGLLGKQDQGHYLEIGAGDPTHINNSYFFEKNFQWKGISIDISSSFISRWYSIRKNFLLIEDATKANYEALLQSFPYVIDYLSLDVDGFYTDVLEKIPFNQHVFKIITIEHDFYRYGDLYREKERQILSSFGYYLLCADVSCIGLTFEDWWIHPDAFPASVFSALMSIDLNAKDHEQLIQGIFKP